MSWAVLSLKNLTNALNKVDDWEGLGIQLDIEYHDLQKIFKDRSTTEERKRAMLQFWLEGDMKPSWEALIAGLDRLNLKLIAEEIKREYHVPSSTQPIDDLPLEPTQSEDVTPTDTLPTDLPSNPHTDQPEQSSAMRVRKVQQEIATLVDKYDDLVAKTGVSLSKQQAVSSEFLFEFRISIAVLPTSLKYQHSYFLKHHCSQVGKATLLRRSSVYWTAIGTSWIAVFWLTSSASLQVRNCKNNWAATQQLCKHFVCEQRSPTFLKHIQEPQIFLQNL